ncbi:MAG: hypothetical protein OXL97_07740 [Chloroflexota bacterium]|nr:hypothetical protein [Chloroflexota bacterium]MDE2885963.1 hypothetical protein [Chloroflexota bacterium]
MLKRLLDLMGAAEVVSASDGAGSEPAADTSGPPEAVGRRGAIGGLNVLDFGAVYAYAVNEGVCADKAYFLGSAYAESLAQGMSRAYSIVYAAAYSIACFIIGAREEWARAYAQACANAIAARESIGFASAYGHAIADGTPPEDALTLARRYAV